MNVNAHVWEKTTVLRTTKVGLMYQMRFLYVGERVKLRVV
ncbi:hypothetical protein OHAE_3499 [Ochrobactrum soli]|uniref:Uncharacterized protein n=1 Tax=Ochrobactrum soli TaxID=2448455 RepID=A0A2P9HHJ3_9HYPH|nr:hypothetical protein OHAE_3499 [[Ochrobactrum] soli]